MFTASACYNAPCLPVVAMDNPGVPCSQRSLVNRRGLVVMLPLCASPTWHFGNATSVGLDPLFSNNPARRQEEPVYFRELMFQLRQSFLHWPLPHAFRQKWSLYKMPVQISPISRCENVLCQIWPLWRCNRFLIWPYFTDLQCKWYRPARQSKILLHNQQGRI